MFFLGNRSLEVSRLHTWHWHLSLSKMLPIWHYFILSAILFQHNLSSSDYQGKCSWVLFAKTANLPFYKNGFSVGHGESRECLVARGRGFWRLWVLNLSGRRVSWVQNCIFSVDYKVTDFFINWGHMHGCMMYTVSVPTNQHQHR